MIISEIFKSIDGESLRAGEISTFIRTQGCPLRCSYCDSKYTWGNDPNCKNMTIPEIINTLEKMQPLTNITFTGGEPLVQPDADELIAELSDKGYDVCIETCGAVDFTSRDWFVQRIPGVWVCVDYKTYSSDMSDKMIDINKFAKLRSFDVVKFVVGSQADLELAYNVTKQIRDSGCNCWIYLSPVFGNIEPKTIVEFMLSHNMIDKVRFQLQLHKFIWDPDMRGV